MDKNQLLETIQYYANQPVGKKMEDIHVRIPEETLREIREFFPDIREFHQKLRFVLEQVAFDAQEAVCSRGKTFKQIGEKYLFTKNTSPCKLKKRQSMRFFVGVEDASILKRIPNCASLIRFIAYELIEEKKKALNSSSG